MTENGTDSLPFEPPEQENIRPRQGNARLRRLLTVHSIPIPQLASENPPPTVVKCRADLERKAVASLSETPARSVRDVCKRPGITVFFMNKYFLAERQAIAEKHRRWAMSATEQRRAKLFLDIHSIATDLHWTGCYPSVKKIVEHLPPGSRFEWTTFNLAVRQARQALGRPK